ncbi:inorganic diphosphatase [Parendozoicomonas haliclonae]|uniref:inorganic diphosphatase n=1 Tax=Parendozoicomonas haliclonae TaxID=1960125 RepID=A0A1X7AKX5_9GAMM|nr:inorganic diphosphatase [Parendozoicomonas haliclonae]SMA47604.1 Inorganic pyrophosphatase [Parendozoicomonas haliclonae]
MKNSIPNYQHFLGQQLTVKVDRPLGSRHPEYHYQYPVNYGFIPNTQAEDREEIDAYILGVNEPISEFTGQCIAIIFRHDDCENKLIIAPEKSSFSDEDISIAVHFQEQYFQTEVVRGS